MYGMWLYYIANNYHKNYIEIFWKVKNMPMHWDYANMVFSIILNEKRVLADLQSFDSGFQIFLPPPTPGMQNCLVQISLFSKSIPS